jgi:hypothetical protein
MNGFVDAFCGLLELLCELLLAAFGIFMYGFIAYEIVTAFL